MKDMCSGYRVGALLVDDEQEFEAIFREALEKVTGRLSFPIRLSYSKDMAEAVEKEETFDIYFIDIELGEGSGIELASRLQMQNFDKEFVFVSAHEKYIKPSMLAKPRAFLCKTSLEKELYEAVVSLKQIWEKKHVSVKIMENRKETELFPQRVCWCESTGHYVDLHMDDKSRMLLRIRLGQLEELFADFHFIRIHSRYLVNLEYIRKARSDIVILKDGSSLSVSRACRKKAEQGIREWFEYLYSLS